MGIRPYEPFPPQKNDKIITGPFLCKSSVFWFVSCISESIIEKYVGDYYNDADLVMNLKSGTW